MKRSLAIVAILGATACGAGGLGFVSCGGGAGAPASSSSISIAMIPKGTSHQFWRSIHAGGDRAAKELGIELIWRGPLREDDRESQVSEVQGFISRGVPDLIGCHAGIEAWVECKQAKAWRVIIRPAQVAFMERRLRAGGKCYLAVRRHNKTADELWLLRGQAARPLIKKSLRELSEDLILMKSSGGPAAWPWAQVGAALADNL